MWPFFQENRLAFEFEGVKKVFFVKQMENMFLFLLVSDHVVTLNCFTVRAHFFDFPIDFLKATTITIRRWGAVRSVSGRAYPPIFYSGGAKIENDETQCKSVKRFFWWDGSAKVELSFERELNFHVFLFFRKKKKLKKCPQILRKLSSRSNQSSTFAIFGGSKMSLQKLSERQHVFTIFPKTRQDEPRWPQDEPSFKIFARTGTDMHMK